MLGEPAPDSHTEQEKLLAALAAGELNPFIGDVSKYFVGEGVSATAVAAFGNAFLTAKLQGKCWQSCIVPALTSIIVSVLITGPLGDKVGSNSLLVGKAGQYASAVITGVGKTIGTLFNTNLKGYLNFFDPDSVRWLNCQ